MPVSLTVSIPDPPAAPPGYTLCAFEVRSLTVGGELEPVAVFPGTTAGFEGAAATLVDAIAAGLKDIGVGLRLAAIAWFSEEPIEQSPDGRERLVSVYEGHRGEAALGGWTPWRPEPRLTSKRVEPRSYYPSNDGKREGRRRTHN